MPVASKTVALADLAGLAGQPIGSSEWREVTQEQVQLFADATGDHQWIHVDPERAAAGPFGGPIARLPGVVLASVTGVARRVVRASPEHLVRPRVPAVGLVAVGAEDELDVVVVAAEDLGRRRVGELRDRPQGHLVDPDDVRRLVQAHRLAESR